MTICLFPANDCSFWSFYATAIFGKPTSCFNRFAEYLLVPHNDICSEAAPDFLSVRVVIGPETNKLPENEAIYDLWVGVGPVRVVPGTAAAELRFSELLANLLGGLGRRVTVLSNSPRFWSFVGGLGGVICRRIHVRIE